MKLFLKRTLWPESWKKGCLGILLAAGIHTCISLPPKLSYVPFASAPIFALNEANSLAEKSGTKSDPDRWIFPQATPFIFEPGKYYFISSEIEDGAPFLFLFQTAHGPLEKFLKVGTAKGDSHLRAVIHNGSYSGSITAEIRSMSPGTVPRLANLQVSELNPVYYTVRDTLEILRSTLRILLFSFMAWIALSLVWRTYGFHPFRYLWQNPDRAWLITIVAIAAILRLYNLGLLAPFGDEIAHLSPPWSNSFWVQFGEGKVLGYWIIKPFVLVGQYLLADRLWSARLAIAFIGVANVVLIYQWVKSLFNGEAGLWAAAIWTFFPFTLIHERLALFDSVVAFFVLLLLPAFTQRDGDSVWKAGLALAAAMLTKIYVLFAIPWLLPLLWLSRKKPGWEDFIKCCQVALYAGLLVGVLMLPWLDLFLEYSRNNAIRIPSGQTDTGAVLSNLSQRPLFNFQRMGRYLLLYGGWAFCVLLSLLTIQTFRKPSPLKRVLCACCIVSLLIHLFAFETWYARYFLFHLLPFLALAGVCLTEIRAEWFNQGFQSSFFSRRLQPTVVTIVLVLVGIHWVWWDTLLLTTPYQLPVKGTDCAQYINPAGNSVAVATGRRIVVAESYFRSRPLTVFTNSQDLQRITEWEYRFGSGIKWELIVDENTQGGVQFNMTELVGRMERVKDRDVLVAMTEPVSAEIRSQLNDPTLGFRTLTDLSMEGTNSLTIWARY